MNRVICENLECRRLLSVSIQAEVVEYDVAVDRVEALGVGVNPIDDARARDMAWTIVGRLIERHGPFDPREPIIAPNEHVAQKLRDIVAIVTTVVAAELEQAVTDLGQEIMESVLNALKSIGSESLKPAIDSMIEQLRDQGIQAIQDQLNQLLQDFAIISYTGQRTIDGLTIRGNVTVIIDRRTGDFMVDVAGQITETDGTTRPVNEKIKGYWDPTRGPQFDPLPRRAMGGKAWHIAQVTTARPWQTWQEHHRSDGLFAID